MTEDEAKTKWCPFVRYASHNGEGINRWVNEHDRQLSPEPARCIASACMAWRGKPTADFTEAKAFAASDRRIDAIKALRVVLPDLNLREAKDIVCGDAPWPVADGGFCGLAGAPQ